jgi:hypothetical protein
MTLLAALSLSLATAAATPAPAPVAADDLRARVHSYLGAIDRPVRAEDWRALGPDAVPVLEEVVASDDLPTRRAAAVAGLAAIGGDRARAAVLAKARAEREPFVVRKAALQGAGRLLEGDALVAALGPALEKARSPAVREAAADVHARRGGAAGCAAVRAQAGAERGAPRAALQRALRRCD